MTGRPLGVALFAAVVLFGAHGPFAAFAQEAKFSVHPAPVDLPKIVFRDGDGRKKRLSDFAGKVIVLNVWATWCAPCRHEMPTLDRLQARLGGAGFEVVALSIDRAGPKVVRAFFKEIGIKNLRLYIDTSAKSLRRLRVYGLPTTILIGRTGKEIGRLIGPAVWDSPAMVAFLSAYLKKEMNK